jgi:hypothetical protein
MIVRGFASAHSLVSLWTMALLALEAGASAGLLGR